MSRLKRREKLRILLLSLIGVVIVLTVAVITCLFRIHSLQKQIEILKEAKIEREQVEADSAGASDSDAEISQADSVEDGPDDAAVDTEEDTVTEEPDTAVAAQTEEAADTAESGDESSAAEKSTPIPADECEVRYVYLTFDDGPSSNTERILEVLDEYNIKATFFVTGREDETSIERYQMIADAGHELAMHSYSHDYTYIYASLENFTADLEKIQSLLTQATGKTPTIYRFPGGSSNTLSVRTLPMQDFVDVLDERGITYFDWNVDSTDGEGPNRPVEELLENVKKNLGETDTSVVLLHDAADHDTTVDALPQIIQYCLDEGYEFGVITEDTPVVHHNRAD